MHMTLGELRVSRDGYARKAAAALAAHWRKPMEGFIDEVAQRPFKHRAGVEVLADTMEPDERATVLRFLELAEQVWEKESEALACLPPFAMRTKRRAA